MQRNYATVNTVEKIKHSIRMIELRLETNAQVLEDSVPKAQASQRQGHLHVVMNNSSLCAIKECKAAIEKLEYIRKYSKHINLETAQLLIQRYNEMPISEIKNIIQLSR